MSHTSLRRFVPGAADVQRKRQLQQMTAAQELAAMRTALRVGRGVRQGIPCQIQGYGSEDGSGKPCQSSKVCMQDNRWRSVDLRKLLWTRSL